jgi:septal ring-binding cell division protein DamX
MVSVVVGILVLTAVLQVNGDVPARTELHADVPLDAIPAEPGTSVDPEEESGTVNPTAPASTGTGRPAPIGSSPTATAGEAAEARARADLARLRGDRAGLTLQLGVVCDADNVRTRIAELGADPNLFFLPFDANGRACYRVCWGVFPDRDAAERARLPADVGEVFTDPPVIKDVSLVAP